MKSPSNAKMPLDIRQLPELEALRKRPALLYLGPIRDDGLPPLYECLKNLGQVSSLDLLLFTHGGQATTARRVALLLREFAKQLTILVPFRAWSSGTLLCLSANHIVLGPMAELSPIDPQIGTTGLVTSDMPDMISAEDIRAFRHMAEEWFGVERVEDRLQVLALVAQRIFPSSLASFYRSEKLVRQIASELLRYQLPDEEETTRKTIVDQLVSGYYAHDYTLSRDEVKRLGLNVSYASPQEETLLWDILQKCERAANEPDTGRETAIKRGKD